MAVIRLKLYTCCAVFFDRANQAKGCKRAGPIAGKPAHHGRAVLQASALPVEASVLPDIPKPAQIHVGAGLLAMKALRIKVGTPQ
ncbi:hypothetical protein [Pseudomonas sp. NPDC089758]|uniref:hypothetical protein n=1 Tax=Pseudomonas sp. NPDC089758 TaxID=3364473 RepID=UPI003807B1A5